RLTRFFEEHCHPDEEIRLIRDGSAYMDIRDANDEWIRLRLSPGVHIVLPAGIYHRFTLDTMNYLRAIRMFKHIGPWTSFNRCPSTDRSPHRLTYLERYGRDTFDMSAHLSMM
ncbi:ARD/ARD' family-domain-containing protein, partial [Fimicolochytrium jonesii]|uniref:ARD/ARD' family-domain-containing protein n=1 Tax=Fimicolochytrium jonesii TaxID=1396493 RepID=UPI0022FE734B